MPEEVDSNSNDLGYNMTKQERIEALARRLGFEKVNEDGDKECWHRFVAPPNNHYFGPLPGFIAYSVLLGYDGRKS